MTPLALATRPRRDLRRYRDLVLEDAPTYYFRCDRAPLATSGPTAQDDIGPNLNLGSAGGTFRAGTQAAGQTNFQLTSLYGAPHPRGGLIAEVENDSFVAAAAAHSRYLAPTVNALPFNVATPVTMECLVFLPLARNAGHMMWATSHGSDGRPYSYILRNAAGNAQIAFAPRGNAGGAGSVLTWVLATAQIPLLTWLHVTITWTGASRVGRLLLNGVSQGALTSTTDIAGTPSFGAVFGDWFNGSHIWAMGDWARFDEIALYNYVLPDARILAHAQRALAGDR